MSLTRIVFVGYEDMQPNPTLYKEAKIPPHATGTEIKIVKASMWSEPDTHIQLELLYGNKCRSGIFGGTAHVG